MPDLLPMETEAQEEATYDRHDLIDRFVGSLDRLGVEYTITAAAGFGQALRQAVRLPAVGAPLPFERLDHDVEVTMDPTAGELESARTGVTAARLGIAAYGSILIQTAPDEAEPISLFPERHVAVLRASDLVPDMPAAFRRIAEAIRQERASLVMATGPSATADMGALVRGAHGPREVHVVILEDR